MKSKIETFSPGTYVRFKENAYEILHERLGVLLFDNRTGFPMLLQHLKQNSYFKTTYNFRNPNNEDRVWVIPLDEEEESLKYYFTQAFEEIGDLEVVVYKIKKEIYEDNNDKG